MRPNGRKLGIVALAGFLSMVSLPALADTLVVGNKGEDTVSFIDLASGKERARVPTGKAPHEVAISPDGRQAAVVAYGGTSVDLLDVTAAQLVRRIELSPGAGPHGIVWLKDNRLVIAAERSKSLVVADPRTGQLRSVQTDQERTHMVVVSPDRKRAFTANISSGTVSVIDLGSMTKLADIATGGYPEGMALSRDGRELWVGDDSAPKLRVIDLASGKVTATIDAEAIAFRLAISPDGGSVITSNLSTGTLTVFDRKTRKRVRTITVSGSPKAMQVTLAFGRDGRRLYVAETMLDTVAEVDWKSGKVLRRIKVGKNGDGLGIAP